MAALRAIRAGRPALIGALVAFSVCAQLGSVAHFALVRHSVCAAHGEAVDVAASAASRPSAHGQPAPEGDAVEASGHESGSDTHDHCLLAIDRSAQARLCPAAGVPVPVPPAAEPPCDVVAAPALQAALLRLAPKTSPPA